MKKKILFVTNVDWFFISHRLIIAEEALRQGYEVYVACEDTGRANEILERGISFINLSFSRSGINLFEEFKCVINFFNTYKRINPDILHQITLKPVIYGSIVARILNIKCVVNAISGLGYNFTDGRKSYVQKIMLYLMKLGFKAKNTVIIFQNTNDRDELISAGIINSRNTITIIKGSGVRLDKYYESPFPEFIKIIVLLPCRMLWDKGIKELREATDQLKAKYFNRVQFVLAGLADADNNAGVPSSYLNDWCDGSYVHWIGYKKNMFEVYQNCHIVVLPSYREGMPKSLLEGCAVGRPIVTTDAVGCRETVDEGINGFKVPIRNSNKLAEALELLIMNPDLMKKMGRNSRIKAELEFDVDFVVKKHLKIYKNLLSN